MNGAGRLAPVEARMYASGAGLGAHAGAFLPSNEGRS